MRKPCADQQQKMTEQCFNLNCNFQCTHSLMLKKHLFFAFKRQILMIRGDLPLMLPHHDCFQK